MNSKWLRVSSIALVCGLIASLAVAQPADKGRKNPDKQPHKQPEKPEKHDDSTKDKAREPEKHTDKDKDSGDSKGKGRGEWRQKYRDELKQHPRLAKALVELHAAKQHLENANHDFGGNKAAAIQACDDAIAKLREAIKFDAVHNDDDDDNKHADGGDKEKREKEEHGKGKDNDKKPGKK